MFAGGVIRALIATGEALSIWNRCRVVLPTGLSTRWKSTSPAIGCPAAFIFVVPPYFPSRHRWRARP
jgi:hypothetical protein